MSDGTESLCFALVVGPSGDLKFTRGVDANGRVPKVGGAGRLLCCMHCRSFSGFGDRMSLLFLAVTFSSFDLGCVVFSCRERECINFIRNTERMSMVTGTLSISLCMCTRISPWVLDLLIVANSLCGTLVVWSSRGLKCVGIVYLQSNLRQRGVDEVRECV